MTQLSRIVDLYFNYDSIVIVTEVYYRREELRNLIKLWRLTVRREQVDNKFLQQRLAAT